MRIVVNVLNGTVHHNYTDTDGGWRKMQLDLSDKLDRLFYTVVPEGSCDIIKPGKFIRSDIAAMVKNKATG